MAVPFTDVAGHTRAKALFQAAIRHHRVAHAYLFHGPDRVGKRRLAIRFIQAMCCDNGSARQIPDSCGTCRSCHQIELGNHPDVCMVTPDRGGAVPRIKIEFIRELEGRLIYRPLLAERKFCLIDDADSLTIEAANALLKTLEEPPGYSLLVLISSRPFALPATIRSRCQTVRLTALSQSEARSALMSTRHMSESDAHLLAAVTEGRLGEALDTNVADLRERHEAIATLTSPQTLRNASAILATAETLAKDDQPTIDTLERLVSWIRDLVLSGLDLPSDRLAHPEHESRLRSSAATADIDVLLEILADIESFQRHSTRNLNPQLLLEHILFRLRDATLAAPPNR